MEYEIINTEENDLEYVYFLFEEAISFQKKNNFIVWKGYDKEVLKKDIENRLQYKIVDGNEITCIFSICYSDPIIWSEMEKKDAVYIHRAVGSPRYRGQSQFEKVFNWAVDHAKQKEFKFIRMDTWADNPLLIEYYKKFGFEYLGNFKTPDTIDLPLQHRDLDLALLEYTVSS